ncbi:hypothetical protein OHW25_04805 [Acinetobacter baumannii]|uniref:hypothetical protein n=1 Tax=Acinetobacter pittii TaxID=48296 RepID=UPI001F06FE98|nr:hypothetical protein [Acinetobacter pittii]MCH2071454.1 hypothetical protein [Acinetobacter pittii]MDC5007599.1 hypothetical protein [Acinetobacter baumannii]MDC5045248.1 hypothetical protein [Acinetobacter baumannii]
MRLILLTLISTLIVGCSTSYKEASGIGNLGVKATIIDDNVFEVTSRINKNTPPYLRREYSIKKAAETSLKLGCTYFVAVGNIRQSFSQTPEKISSGLQRLNNGALVYTSKTGTQYNVVNPNGMVVKYVCFNEKPEAVLPGLVFNAKYILQS